MQFDDWLLFFHVLSAFLAVGAMSALWAMLLATRPAAPVLRGEAAGRLGKLAGALVGAGMVGAIVFGIWLTLNIDGYELWDGWILGSLVLWAVAGFTGDRAGRVFLDDTEGGRAKALQLHAISSVAVVVILILMLWKPGA